MASFQYVAVNKGGRQVKGVVEAENQMKATASIKADGLVPVEIKEQGVLDKDIQFDIFKKKVKTRDLSLFCRQFVSMHRAGVTILESLKLLMEQSDNPTLKEATQQAYLDVQKGDTLANSLKKRSDVFPSLLIQMVAAGEASGSLDVAFERMAVQFEKSARIQGLVKKAMVYPIVVACVAVLIVIILLTVVVPNFIAMFADMDIKMPAITLAVVAMSEFLQKFWWLVAIIVAAIVAGFSYARKTPTGEEIIAKAALIIPMFGKLTTKANSAKFSRNLSTMLAAGIPLPEAVEITAETMSNLYFKRAMMAAKSDVMQGVPLSQPMERCGLFPPMVYHMTRIGEETGNMEEMLDRMADYYDEEVEVATQSMMAALEPMMIIFMAVVCGGIIGAVMAPMVSMYEGLDQL